MRASSSLPWLSALLLVPACAGAPAGSTASTESTAEPSPPTGNDNVAPSPSPAPVAAAAAPFEVHEWGVVDVPLAGTPELAAGPGRPQPQPGPMPVRKPVLYFHLDPGAAPLEVEVAARIPGGQLLEQWPNLTQWPELLVTGDGVRWPRATLAPCAVPLAPLASRMPIPLDQRAGCGTPDGYCEIYDLGLYQSADASCLTHRDVTARLLFYRGSVVRPALPHTIARDASGARSVRTSAPGGSPLLFVRGGRGIELPWPAPGAEVVLPDAFSESFDGPRLASSMARMVRDAGLTEGETEAFMLAWSEEFFGAPWGGQGATRDLAERESGGRWPAPARRARPEPPILLYVMPEASVPALAELTITPAPRVLRRVMVVRVELAR
jgi:hypothetical protein